MDVPFPPFVQDLQTFSEAMQTSKVEENLHRKTPEKL